MALVLLVGAMSFFGVIAGVVVLVIMQAGGKGQDHNARSLETLVEENEQLRAELTRLKKERS